ncbi:hypothetical protein, partial [Escherichia coli]
YGHGACVEQDDKGWDARKRAYCLKTQPATGETYPKSDLFNKATWRPEENLWIERKYQNKCS